ncbi:uncharacterized protein F4812DRAFT_171929 [Daldinia caldariorum]|uniref:uncharacterized protein n=1 Tax=Daldinia caldariorum TaxID=326644 RepID=UPI00200866C3|nr:uncharacterized protein F4812DRAFT_171929 [Daldinia caldariorum]KAI1471270.1 hypothetical protein F4812DRAFT_171929 [Daldinia caldariorum]
MTNETLPESLRFLTDAAHLLVKTAPEASAYLMAQRNSLLFHNDLEQSDLQRQHACGACGHIMIPGQGSELKIESNMGLKRRKAKKKNSTSKGVTEKSMSTVQHRKRFTCGMCSRYTDFILPLAPPTSRRRPLKSTKSLSLDVSHRNARNAPTPPEPVKTSANASSKKRAKSRKQGLQALLQQAQSSASKSQSGLGLSLSDFMSK